MQTYLILAAIIATTIVGDYFIKIASDGGTGLISAWFVAGALIYGLTAVGFYFLLRTHSLAQTGVLYSAATIILMSALGYFVFGERLGLREGLGIGLALAAIVVMGH